MKKVFLSLAVLASVAMVSCGNKAAEGENAEAPADSAAVVAEGETVVVENDSVVAPVDSVATDSVAVEA